MHKCDKSRMGILADFVKKCLYKKLNCVMIFMYYEYSMTEKIMGKKHREKMSMMFGLTNVKRCFAAALLSVVVFPVLLVLSLFAPEFATDYMVPVAFFSVGSAAFAYLLHQVAKNKIKRYYDMVTLAYLTAFHLFFVYIAQENILFYYAAVMLTAYMVLLSLDRYVIMALGELVCYMALVVKSGAAQIPMGQLLFLTGLHLFAFVLSRDLYNTKKSFLVEEKKLRREMQESEHDPMTGLMNRRGLERHVEGMWQASRNRQETVAAFVIDIDLFKSYNDRFGHVQGDACIRKVAQSIAETVRGYGIAARIGGEEFLVFVKGRGVQEVYDLAEQVRADVEHLNINRGTTNGSVITVSVGMDIRCATEDVSLQGLYGRADKALYQAKQDGRNCVRSAQNLSVRRVRIG